MRFVWLKVKVLVLLAAAASAAAQTNPHTQIRWPPNCNNNNYMAYNYLANTCILVGPTGADKQVQFNAAGAWGIDAGFTYDPATHMLTAPNLNVPGTSGVTIPPSGVQWPPACSSGVYVPSTNTCIPPGTAANPAGSSGQVQYNAGGVFGGYTGPQAVAAIGAAGWVTGSGVPALPCTSTVNNGYFYTSTNQLLYQCSNANAAATYQWNPLAGKLQGPTAALESNASVPFAQPATGISIYNGVISIGDSTGGSEWQWLMDASQSAAVPYYGSFSGSIATAGDTAADSTARFFAKYAPGPLNNPAVIQKIGTNDGRYRGHVGDGIGGTGTKMGYLRFADSNVTWAALSPQEKRPATLYPFTTTKVIMTGTTVTLQIEALRYAHESLAVNAPILLNGFTANTGLNGRVWHIASRSDMFSSSTQLTLSEACSSGCSSVNEVGTISLAYWTNTGFAQDTGLGSGEQKANGNPALVATAAGAVLTSQPATSNDSVWIGPSGLLFVWYYAYNNGTGTFTVSVNGAVQTDYFTGSSTLTNNTAPNLAQNILSTTPPMVALAAFTGLTPNSFAQVQINVTAASAGLGAVGIVGVGSPLQTDSMGGSAGAPNAIWTGVYYQCETAVCGGGLSNKTASTFYNDTALAEATRLGASISNGGWGLNVRPADIRSATNPSFDFLNPALTTGQDPIHGISIPQHIESYKAIARAMGVSISGGNGGQFAANLGGIGVNDYQIGCTQVFISIASSATVNSFILPSCAAGKWMVIWNATGTISTSPQTPITVRNPDGAVVASIYNGEWAEVVSFGNPGAWNLISQSGQNNKVIDRMSYFNMGATGTLNFDPRFKFVSSSGAGLTFAGYAGAIAVPAGEWLIVKNTSASVSVPIIGASSGDLPAALLPMQSILIFTTGANAWYVAASYPGVAIRAGIATLVGGTVSTVTSSACTPAATCTYKLTNCGVSGAQGMLSVGTVTAGTSFAINSSNSGDTSTICWQIN